MLIIHTLYMAFRYTYIINKYFVLSFIIITIELSCLLYEAKYYY